MGTQPKRSTAPPQFLAHVCCSQTAAFIQMPLGVEVGLGPGYIMLCEDPAPPKEKGHMSPHFLTCVYCGQMAGWMKIPLGTKVGLGPGNIVLDGNQLPQRKGAQQPPILTPRLLWPNGWMDQDTIWYGGRPWPSRCCVRWRPSSSMEGHSSPPHFSAHCSSMVAHLSCCWALVHGSCGSLMKRLFYVSCLEISLRPY